MAYIHPCKPLQVAQTHIQSLGLSGMDLVTRYQIAEREWLCLNSSYSAFSLIFNLSVH